MLIAVAYTFYVVSTSGEHQDQEDVTVPVDIHVMDTVTWPKEFAAVEQTWGCDPGPGTLCLTTDLSGEAAATRLARVLGVTSYDVVFGRDAHTRYTVCGDIDATPVVVGVSPRVSNAVLRNGYLIVPAKAEPKYDGLAIGAWVSETPCNQY
jgi:hypothetical protein